MAGISKLPGELRIKILGWLNMDQDTLVSLYNTSTTFRSSVVFYLIEREPQLLILWAAETGASKLLERVLAQYPGATINRSSTVILHGICPPSALVIAAGKGHAKVVELILTVRTIHHTGLALFEAAEKGHADVVSVMLKNSLGHHSSVFHDSLSAAIQRGHMEVKKVFREYGNPACHHCAKDLNLTARGVKRREKGVNGKMAKREKGKISGQHRVAK